MFISTTFGLFTVPIFVRYDYYTMFNDTLLFMFSLIANYKFYYI